MPQRLNDIIFTASGIKKLKSDIVKVFFQHYPNEKKFTNYKKNNSYTLLQKDIADTTSIHIGTNTLIRIMTLDFAKPYSHGIISTLKRYIDAFSIAIKSPSVLGGQKIYWGVNQGLDPGAFIENINGEFIKWDDLKKDLEEKVITQCPRVISPGAKVEMKDFYGKKNWVLEIIDLKGREIGSVWIGGNPDKNWEQDGFIRIGKGISDTQWVVYQVLARFPDGSYRLVKSFV
jgi:hypothetical protein